LDGEEEQVMPDPPPANHMHINGAGKAVKFLKTANML
jgi:hypothetical protein